MSKQQMPPRQRPKAKKGTLGRVLKMLIKSFPVLVPVAVVCIVLSALVSSIPSIFTKNIIEIIENCLKTQTFTWEIAKAEIFPLITVLVVLYVLSLIFITVQSQLMAFITQAVTVLQTLVIALGAGLAVWGVVNLMEGYGNDNPGAKSQGIKQLMAGGGVVVIGTTLIPLLSGLF